MVVVVTQVLTGDMIEAGKRTVQRLDKAKFPFSGALWLLDDEMRAWKFVLVAPAQAKLGPKALYERLRRVLAHPQHEESLVPLSQIFLASDHDSIVRLLSAMVKTGPGLHGIRMTGNTVNGRYIEDAYVYRLR